MMPNGRRGVNRTAGVFAEPATAEAGSPRPCCMGGSDGDRLREIDAVSPPLVPFLYPDAVHRSLLRRGAGRYARGAKPPRIPRERWPEVAARAQGESLRSIARDFAVSHETIRAVLRNPSS